jgi:hypothetical protein
VARDLINRPAWGSDGERRFDLGRKIAVRLSAPIKVAARPIRFAVVMMNAIPANINANDTTSQAVTPFTTVLSLCTGRERIGDAGHFILQSHPARPGQGSAVRRRDMA